jgi:hypothetical protein
MTGGVKKVVVVRAEQGVKVAGWDPNGFRVVGVRWGVGWLKSTRGGGRWDQTRVSKRDRYAYYKQPAVVVSGT